MDGDESKRGRRTIRLQDYDYAAEGLYFITICSNDRMWLFGDLTVAGIELTEFGTVLQNEWRKTAILRPNVELDEFVVMPDHFHAIIFIRDRRGVLQHAPARAAQVSEMPSVKTRLQSPSQTVGAIVRGFKGTTTKQINEMRRTPGLPVWQRNYYEHIIRNDEDLNEKRRYICSNPEEWIRKR